MRRLRVVGITLSILLSALIVHAGATTVKAILENPSRYDGQEVTISGKASSVKPTTSRKGNDYMTFQVTDSSGAGVTVFTWGHPTITSGSVVRVTGTFQRVKRVGRRIFYNQIDANRVSLVKP
jgi:hypothetical protein